MSSRQNRCHLQLARIGNSSLIGKPASRSVNGKDEWKGRVIGKPASRSVNGKDKWKGQRCDFCNEPWRAEHEEALMIVRATRTNPSASDPPYIENKYICNNACKGWGGLHENKYNYHDYVKYNSNEYLIDWQRQIDSYF